MPRVGNLQGDGCYWFVLVAAAVFSRSPPPASSGECPVGLDVGTRPWPDKGLSSDTQLVLCRPPPASQLGPRGNRGQWRQNPGCTVSPPSGIGGAPAAPRARLKRAKHRGHPALASRELRCPWGALRDGASHRIAGVKGASHSLAKHSRTVLAEGRHPHILADGQRVGVHPLENEPALRGGLLQAPRPHTWTCDE